ncbi:MAG TPA: FkbM family methyltransferase [Burkholderiales bacterium]|nr:FkbM family methyltransferase [Burkholderiales bacterium]
MNKTDRKQGFNDSLVEVKFAYEGQPIAFRTFGEKDHISGNMLRRKTFYEVDVLERIRDRVKARASATAIDAGAFIGTHSTYFAKFCGLTPVVAFEPNPNTFPLLKHNIAANQLNETVIAIGKALGASPGYALVECAQSDNQGGSTVSFVTEECPGSVEVSTVDVEVQALSERVSSVALIKIDVEGLELPVLEGAMKTISAHRPVLCIEVHTLASLRKVISVLRCEDYWIIDCLGYSPTYILEPTTASYWQKVFVHSLWYVRTVFPGGQSSRPSYLIRWYLRRLAQLATTGIWDPVTCQ